MRAPGFGHEDTFKHYYHGALPVFDRPSRQADSQQRAYTAMQQLTVGARRVWGLNHSGGSGHLQAWLSQNG